jgi:hypothetical protein
MRAGSTLACILNDDHNEYNQRNTGLTPAPLRLLYCQHLS